MDIFQVDYPALALAFVHVVLIVIVLALAKLALNVLSPYSTDQELTTRDNPAFGVAIAGYYAATVIIYLAAAGMAPLPLNNGSRAVFLALAVDLLWALAGIVVLNGSRWLLDRALATGVRNDIEIAKHRNVAAGAVEGSAYVASATVLAGAIRQPGGTIWTTIALFLLGQLALIGMAHAYSRWRGYDVAGEIRSGNLSAGLAFGMTLVALSLLMLKAIAGDFVDWRLNLSYFAFDAVAGWLLLMLLRWITDMTLLPHARVKDEIVRDRNVNAGMIEGVLAIGIAAVVLFLF
jgi:uncharacterized membrane protein YjfL (UPF0719 family)